MDPKNTVKNMKHFKIQLLFKNQKNTAAVTSTQKIQILEIQNPVGTRTSWYPCLLNHISSSNGKKTVGSSPAPSAFLEQSISNTADNVSPEEDFNNQFRWDRVCC